MVSFDEFDKKIDAARSASKAVIYKIILLSSSIVGFSVSLFSVPTLGSHIDICEIKKSWYFFLATIVTGFFILLIEPRIDHAKTWKGFHPSQAIDTKSDLTIKERIAGWCIAIISLVHPSNLLFNKIYDIGQEKNSKESVNFFVTNLLARLGASLILLESILFILFTLALILLVRSVQ